MFLVPNVYLPLSIPPDSLSLEFPYNLPFDDSSFKHPSWSRLCGHLHSALGCILCCYSLEVLNTSLFELVFCAWSLMEQKSAHMSHAIGVPLSLAAPLARGVQVVSWAQNSGGPKKQDGSRWVQGQDTFSTTKWGNWWPGEATYSALTWTYFNTERRQWCPKKQEQRRNPTICFLTHVTSLRPPVLD